ncbi:MAG: DUF1150 family protein [Boseongicola sp.]|nr:DUF1150 family protein [Boseongicola sp.]MDD9977109.1 DUF1150 family protein [Boseongicola sp.]
MNTPYNFEDQTGDRIVYVRPVDVSDLPQELQDQAGSLDQIYAVHSTDGSRLALVKDRSLAFELARQNDLAPVNVH